MLTASFPSLTLSFIALSLPLMHIINVLSQLSAGKRCWVDTLVYYYHLGQGRVQAYQELSKFLIEQVSQKEVLDDAESEHEYFLIRNGLEGGKVYCEKGNENKGNELVEVSLA